MIIFSTNKLYYKKITHNGIFIQLKLNSFEITFSQLQLTLKLPSKEKKKKFRQ